MVKIENTRNKSPHLMGRLKTRKLLADKKLRMAVYHLVLPPKTINPEFIHDKTDEFVYVLNGSARGKINGRKVKMKKNDFFLMPAGTRHQLETTNTSAEVVVIFHGKSVSGEIEQRMVKS